MGCRACKIRDSEDHVKEGLSVQRLNKSGSLGWAHITLVSMRHNKAA